MDQKLIRNFAIIAHIDHGKSTLADRFLELTGTVDRRNLVEQTLDTHPVSRQRGITIRLSPVTMNFKFQNSNFKLNLIDTPGHVDFSYEVERSLAACEGAILLVDATQGIQAQTLSHFDKAKKLGLKIIPAINKIDMPNTRVEETIAELAQLVQLDKSAIFKISARTGDGVKALLEEVIKNVPPPAGNPDGPTKTQIFSSQYNQQRGVVAFVKVLEGKLTGEVGHFTPFMTPAPYLSTGEVGYLLTNIKDPEKIHLWEGYQPPKPMVFVSFFPVNQDEFNLLEDALKKLRLNDAAITFSPTSSKALGRGFRCGFLGHLHAEVSQERLETDFNLSIIATAPTVEYKILGDSETNSLTPSGHLGGAASHEPEANSSFAAQEVKDGRAGRTQNLWAEPWIKATIITPQAYVGAVITLCEERRGKLINMEYHGTGVTLFYELPLAEIITDFFDQLKSKSSGFASFDYEFWEYRPFDAVQLVILINHESIDAFSQMMEKTRAEKFGKRIVEKLAEIIPRQQIPIPIQASINGQVVARADIKSFRKDVTAKLYGGDVTRRMKLLEKQKKGKEKMKQIGKVQIPGDTFLKVFKT
ncbi:translation elongation factor 4 [Patescibacteria group bacterium]|nr:translation elongation factor 4 [Patescibacteria group bacterium]